MNQKSKRMIPKLIALLLLCFCLLPVIPAEAAEAEDQPKIEGNTTEEAQPLALGQSGGKETRYQISYQISHVKVVYCHYQGEEDAATAEFVEVSENDQLIARPSDGGYYVYFLQPEPGYLLTEFTGLGNRTLDLYSVDADKVYISGYEGISTVLDRAKGDYIGWFGYRASAMTSNVDVTHVFKAEKPEIQVTATASPGTGVRPDSMVTFHISVTPQHTQSGTDTITSRKITSLKINDTVYQEEELTKNADGTYSIVYQVSREEWEAQKVHLDVEASIDFTNTLNLKDSHGNKSRIITNTTVTGSSDADCSFAAALGVDYQISFLPEDVTPPDTIPAAPVDSKEYFTGEKVTVVNNYGTSSIDDPENGGTWTFDGWYQGSEKAGNILEMGRSPIFLHGIWKFEKYPEAELTITKQVSGNMYDATKNFSFTVVADKEMTYGDQKSSVITFQLKKDGKRTLKIPAGAKVTITEDPAGYEYRFEAQKSTICGYELGKNSVSFVMPAKCASVVITNHKDVLIDTGVFMENAPYVILLSVTAAGTAFVGKQRGKRGENENK